MTFYLTKLTPLIIAFLVVRCLCLCARFKGMRKI